MPGPIQATAASCGGGGEIEKIVQTLKAKGVTFEHYELPGLTRKGDIFIGENMKAAWLKRS